MDCNRPMEFIHYNQCHLHLEISCQQDSPYCMFHHRHKIVSLWHWLLVLAKEIKTGSLLHVLMGRSDFFLGPQSFVEGAALVPGTVHKRWTAP